MDADDPRIDDLDKEIDSLEAAHPGYRAGIEDLTAIVQVTAALWRRREELGLSIDEVAERAGLSPEQVEAIEDNDMSAPFHDLARYGKTVGLEVALRVSAA